MRFQAVTNSQRKLTVNWDHVNAYVSRWKPGTALDIEIVRRERKVSDPLRRYYYSAVLPPFMAHLGYDPDEAELFHRQLKVVFFGIKPDSKGIYRKVPHVFSNDSEIPVSKKVEFVEWCIRKAAIEGVYIEPAGGSNESLLR